MRVRPWCAVLGAVAGTALGTGVTAAVAGAHSRPRHAERAHAQATRTPATPARATPDQATPARATPAHATHPATAAACPWLNERLPIARRVSLLLDRMTLPDKIAEMHVDTGATSGPYAGYEGYVPAQPQLCIPDLVEQDDSLGVGAGATGVTQLPSESSLGSTWDPSLAFAYGAVNGRQHFDKGIAMALAPGINIDRDPRWGRNFEMFSEDPLLTARLGVADIDGLQSEHVMADVKHFAVYNQETYRNTPLDDAIVDQRTLHEIYLPPFYDAVTEAHAASIMCSYAELNGTYSCEDPVLSQILNDRWHYTGFIRSDGGANHSTVASAIAGLDQERGSDLWDGGLLADAVNDGQVPIAVIDDAVTRILTQMFRFDLFNDPPTGTISSRAATAADAAFAQAVAERGTVLLRNQARTLPLNPATTKSIAVIGADGTTDPLTAGGGSSSVTPPYRVSPLAGISARAGNGVTVRSYSGTDPTQAAATARTAQTAIVFVSQYESEGSDLSSIELPDDQDALIEAVAAANPNTIVVLNTGGPVAMPWLDSVKGVLEAWYPGQQDGDAIAAVLFGDVDPGGHLPETFPASLSQIPTDTPQRWPGVDGQVSYSEGLDVGYRYDAARQVTPLFPFGFGLSYTHFAFHDLRVHADRVNRTSGPDTARGQAARIATVTARITNTGDVAGADVAQLYLDDPAAATEPPEQLEGFQRVTLAPHRSATVRFILSGHALSWYDTPADGWVLSAGRYRVSVGDSSAAANLPLHGAFAIRRTLGARDATLQAPAQVDPGRSFTVTARFVNHGDLTEPAGRIRLSVPAGWSVRPATAHVDALRPGAVHRRRFVVRAPRSTVAGATSLTVVRTGPGPAGSGDLSAQAQLTVAPAIAVAPPAVTLATPGATTTATVTLTGNLARAERVRLAPVSAGGVTVTPATSVTTVPAHGTRTVALAVAVAAGTASGEVPIALDPSAPGTSLAPAELHVEIAAASLAAAADTTGISSDADIAAADFDGYGNSLSSQALAAAGLTPGASITVGAGHAQWTSAAPGTPDSVLADGQTIALAGTPGDTTLTFLGASSNADTTGTGTIEYTDGSTQSFTLTLGNWFDATPPAGDVTVATLPYVNDSTGHGNGGHPGRRDQTVRVFGTTVSLTPGKTVAAVTLPAIADSPLADAMHVFGLGLG